MRRNYVLRTIKLLFSEKPGRMLLCIGILVVIAAFSPLAMYIISRIVDLLNKHVGDTTSIFIIVFIYGIVLLLSNSLPLINILGSYLWITAEISLQKAIMKKIEELSCEHFDCEKYYSKLQLAKESYGNAIGSTMMLVSAVCTSVISLLVISSFLSVINWVVPSILAIVLCLKVIIYNYIGNRTRLTRENLAEDIKDQKLLSSYLCTKDSLVFGVQPYFFEKWRTLTQSLQEKIKYNNQKNTLIIVLFDLALYCLYVVACLVVILQQIAADSVSIGDLVLVIVSLDYIYSNIDNAITQIGNVYKNRNISQALFDFLDSAAKTGITHQIVPGSLVKLQNVSYSYPGSMLCAIDNLNIEINMGETIAVVGKNGSGKSTFIKILSGLYAPSSGEITYGQEFGLGNNETTNMTAVFQDFNIYKASIKENIVLGDIYSNVSKPEDQLRHSGADTWVNKLPSGIDTLIGIDWGGVQLSGGEGQQLAIARSFFRRYTLAFLDEPTSNIDPILEDMLHQLFYQKNRNKTAIIVSHRLSSAKFADRIIVFDKGKIVEVGTHNELLQKKGMYYQLYSLQQEQYLH